MSWHKLLKIRSHAKAVCELMAHPVYGRYLKLDSRGLPKIDRGKIKIRAHVLLCWLALLLMAQMMVSSFGTVIACLARTAWILFLTPTICFFKAARWWRRVLSSLSSLDATQQAQTKSAANSLAKISASTLSVLILASAMPWSLWG